MTLSRDSSRRGQQLWRQQLWLRFTHQLRTADQPVANSFRSVSVSGLSHFKSPLAAVIISSGRDGRPDRVQTEFAGSITRPAYRPCCWCELGPKWSWVNTVRSVLSLPLIGVEDRVGPPALRGALRAAERVLGPQLVSHTARRCRRLAAGMRPCLATRHSGRGHPRLAREDVAARPEQRVRLRRQTLRAPGRQGAIVGKHALAHFLRREGPSS